MQAVNLLPSDAVQKRKRQSSLSGLPSRKTLQIGGAVAALCAILMAGLFVYERSVVSDKKSELARNEVRLSDLQARAEPIRQQQADAAARLAVVKRITESRMNWDRTMGDLSRVLPTDAYLTSLQASAPSVATTAVAATTDTTSSDTSTGAVAAPPAAPPTTSLTLSGVTPSHVRVATVLDRLALLPWLSNITLQTSTRGADGTATFTLTGVVSEVH